MKYDYLNKFAISVVSLTIFFVCAFMYFGLQSKPYLGFYGVMSIFCGLIAFSLFFLGIGFGIAVEIYEVENGLK